MRKTRVLSLTLAVIVGLLAGCGGKPTSPSSAVTTLSVSITGAASSMHKGQSVQLKAVANLSDGSQLDVTASAVWRSHNSNIATISASGLLTAVAPGICNIEADSSGVKGQTQVSVKSGEMTGITIAGNATFQSAGQTSQMSATANFSDGSKQDVTGSAVWTSSAPAVASVSSDGVVTARGNGEADISAAVGDQRGVIRARVGGSSPPKVVALRVEGNTSLALPGQTSQLKAIAKMSDGADVDVTANTEWSTSNGAVASISASGLLTAQAPGDCQIKALHAGLSADVQARVAPDVPKIVKLVISGPSKLTLGQTLRFKAIAHMSDGSEVDVSGSAVWSTTNSLVSVAADGGLVTALGLGSCEVLAVHAGVTARASLQITLTE